MTLNVTLPTMTELLQEFDSGKIPRSETWHTLITALYASNEQVAQIEFWYNQVEAAVLTSESIQTDVQQNHDQVQIWHGEVSTWHSQVDTWQQQVSQNTTLSEQYKNEASSSASAAAQSAADAGAAATTLLGGIQELGSYDASTNTLPAKPPNNAGFWKITGAGTLNGVDYGVGDTLVYSKTTDSFYKIDNTESVTSVNGQQGAVTIPPASTTIAGIVQLDNTETSDSTTKAATANAVKIVFDATAGLATSLAATTLKADEAHANAATAQAAAIDAINDAAAAQTTADGKVSASIANTFTAPQSGSVTSDNDLSFDMSAGNNFSCTPAASGTLTFTNITAGQSGNIYFDNAGGHAISASASTLINASDLGNLSLAGQYWVSYFSADGLNVSVAVTPALKAGGA